MIIPLLAQLHGAGFPEPEVEWKFDDSRAWRFDFAWPDMHPPLAVEIEGGVFSGGRHVRGVGYSRDLEKYNAAALAGWTVLRFTTRQVASGLALATIERAFRLRAKENSEL